MSEREFLKEKDLLLNCIEKNTAKHWENYYSNVPIKCIFEDLVIDINEIKRLTEENQELKKQIEYLRRSVERKEETIIDLQNEIVPYTNEYVCKLENQQKEFIEFLENEKNIYPYDISDYTYEDIINTILSKYYEIIGSDSK